MVGRIYRAYGPDTMAGPCVAILGDGRLVLASDPEQVVRRREVADVTDDADAYLRIPARYGGPPEHADDIDRAEGLLPETAPGRVARSRRARR